MIGKLRLYLTFLLSSVKYSVLEEANVSDCLDEEHYRYQAYTGETLYFQCNLTSNNSEKTIQWFLQKPYKSLEEEKSRKDLNVSIIETTLQISPLEKHNSGTYICRRGNLCMKMRVQAIERKNCENYGPNRFFFRNTDEMSMSCPSLNCPLGKNIRNVTWYKTLNFSSVTYENRFSLKINNNEIQFSKIYTSDAGIYICDYVLYMQGKEWIIRATIQVSVDFPDAQQPPQISGPSNGTKIEAEFGKPFKLICKVIFGYERSFNPIIKWTVLHPESKKQSALIGGRELCLYTTRILIEYECILTMPLESVTNSDLHAIYQCSAQNSVGNVTSTVKLSRKEADIVFRRTILCVSVMLLLIMLLGAGTVYLYWVEIVLLYRHYLSKDETIGDDKDFDAFISYATQTSEFSEEKMESYFDNYEDEQFATQLLPSVLEDNFNYKLCILERDILPGGAYVEDIAKIIKRSRRAIFILSQRYITGPRLFELQAAITRSLEEQENLKLILIKLKPFKEPETIPLIVKKALRALPTVSWKGDINSKSAHTSKFWKRIRYYMPVKKNR
ncbi:interleukin-18 receptor accessory protein-like isoform X1 [Phyllobates terribilis]|uniref:interleukin-18 receptor accessory protein-like isoform X1 n=1 Tax=Phyllobates terribilis TaxID=111132 RepID=UPI003CCAB274